LKCLLLVDIQAGFCTGGHLAVPGGEEIVPVANRLIASGGYDLIVASQDWHPADHGSFASQHPGAQPFEMGELGGKPQMLWPDHCVQGTSDAEFHPDLNVAAIDHVQRKGLDRSVDSYSAFRDNDQAALTGLSDYLSAKAVTTLDICGLATDYCVKASAIDARAMLDGVAIRFISDASRGIDPVGVAAALHEMRAAGIAIVTASDCIGN
jgi:nicotinamidase/pyrazinamidase